MIGTTGQGRMRAVVVVAAGLLVGVAGLPVIAGSSPVPSYSGVAASDGPEAHFRFGESAGSRVATDAAGGGDGVYVGTPALEPTGVVPGGSSVLLGGDDRVELPTRSMHGTGFTVEAWIRTSSRDATADYAGNAALTVFGDHTNDVWFSFGVHGGRLQLSRYSASANTWQRVVGSTDVADDEWHHVVATTSKAGQGVVYVDGFVDGVGRIDVESVDRAAVTRIGAGYGNRDGFRGAVAEAAIYRSVLDVGRVHAHFTAAQPPVAASSPEGYSAVVSASAPVAHYRLGEWVGSTAFDSSAGGRDGRYVGTGPRRTGGVVVDSADGAGSFDGSSLVEVPPVELGRKAFTVEAWIRTTSDAAVATYGGDAALTVLGEVRNTVWFNFGIDDGRVRVARHGAAAGEWAVVEGITKVNDGGWHHIAASTSVEGGAAVFVDGVLDAVGALPVSGDDRAAVTRVGSGFQNRDRFVGDLDEVAMYDRVLTAAVIRERFRAATGREPAAVDTALRSNRAWIDLQDRVNEIAQSCLASAGDVTNPTVTVDVMSGTCDITPDSTGGCGWRQFFCDHADELVLGIAATTGAIFATLAVIGTAGVAAPTVASAWSTLGATGISIPTGVAATSGGALAATSTITITAAGALVVTAGTATAITITQVAPWLYSQASGGGTVWDHVTATDSPYPGTEVPRSLRLTLEDGAQVWLHPNATKHIAERVAGSSMNGPISVQSQLRSLRAAISEVNRSGVSLGKMYNVGGWELQFGIRSMDDLAVVNHARYVG